LVVLSFPKNNFGSEIILLLSLERERNLRCTFDVVLSELSSLSTLFVIQKSELALVSSELFKIWSSSASFNHADTFFKIFVHFEKKKKRKQL